MKTKKIAIVLLISLFVISLVWADNKATLSKTDIQKEQKVERVKVEKVEAEKEVVEKAEAPNLSSKGDVAVEKKATLIEVKKSEKPIRTTPEIKKVDEAEKEVAEKLAAEKAKRAMLPSTSAKGTKAEELRRRVPGPKADFPQERKKALESGKVFKVTGDRDLIDVQVSVTVDNYPSEASWNLWSYDDGAYFYATNQTFSAAYENQTVIFSLTLGSLYSVDCWDTYGDGGIEGMVTDVPTGGILVSWGGGDYGSYGNFEFVAEEGAAPDPGETCETAVTAVEGLNSCPGAPFWYEFTATMDGVISISSCIEGQEVDTKLYVYDACGGTQVAYNDDLYDDCPYYNYASGVAFPSIAGISYKIYWDPYWDTDPFDFTVEEGAPCVVECPEWGIPEGEPCLVDEDVDNFNGGCNSEPPVFSPIGCGETICGTASTYLFQGSNYRDTDWYEVVLTQQWQVTWTGEAEFPLLLFIIDAGSGDCVDYTILGSASGNPCDVVTLTAIVTPGTYWLWAGPSVFDGYPCNGNNDYVATLTCEPVTIPQGATCEDPLIVTLPADLTYQDFGQTTCGMLDDYDATCLGYYDGGEDIIYEVTVTEEVTVDITMDPLGTTWTGLAIDDECPPADPCMAYDTGSSGIRTIEYLTLAPGTYYIMVDTWPSPDCIPAFDLTIEPSGEPDPGETCETAIPYTYVGDPAITGPLDPYQEIWYSFEATEEFVEVYVDLCASDFDTKLEVWLDCADPSYTYYNDDYCGLQSWIQTGCMFEGDVWYAKVYGYGSASGTYVLDITGLPGTCPEAPPNDLCENAEYIGPPYPATTTGTTIGATGPDCPGVLDWVAVWYEIELPYECNDLTIDFLGDALIDNAGIVVIPDCESCADYIPATAFDWGGPGADYWLWLFWDDLPGPCTVMYPQMTEPTMNFELTVNVEECVPCVVECPEWGIPEGEACLVDGDVDNYNGGCNSDPPVFSYMSCGETICGIASTFIYDGGNYRDTDWYEFTLGEGSWTITADAIAEFDLLIFLMDAGSGNCEDYTILGSATGIPCQDISLNIPYVIEGTYWLWVGPSVFTGYPCDEGNNDYVATLTCEPVTPTYCPASGGCDEYIERIEIGTIDNTSLCDEYADYTDQSTDLLMGVGAPLTLTIGNAYSSDVGGAWVDWNQDLDFYDAGEFFYLGTGLGPYTADIVPPAGATLGPTRMRVRLCWGCDLDPCGATPYGEVEDYTVNVLPIDEPVLCVVPSSHDFGGVPIGDCSLPQTFTIDNCGVGTIEVSDVVITGPDAGDFILTDLNTYPAYLPPAITVDIEFCPSSAGVKTAFLTITDDRLVTDVELFGTGYVGLVCPEGTIFGQPSHMPDDDWSAATSEDDPVYGIDYIVYDNFWGLEEPICNIHFWGLSLVYPWAPCDEDPMPFEIKFYLDAAGYPGDEVCSYEVDIFREATEQYYAGFPLYYYSTDLDPCCDISEGWVSIQGQYSDPECWFMWMSSGIGDGFCYQSLDGGATYNDRFYDQSMCLTGPGAPETSLILPEYTEGCPGQAVTIPVYLDNPEAWDVEGIDMVITFDELVLDATGGVLGPELAALGYGLFVNTIVDGQVTVVIYAMTDLFSGSGDVVLLDFNVVGAEGTYTDLTFTFGEVNETPVGLFDGFFNVVPCAFDVSGFIGYYDGLAPIPTADVNLDSYAETTDEFGEYLFEDLPGGDYDSTPFKDTDLEGLSGLDASRIARFAGGLYAFDCMQWIASDVSLNGETSGMDASRVARYSAGIITELNTAGIEWVFTVEMITDCPDWEPIVYENTYYYAPLDTDMFDQDFFGIRLGDVSGNWAPDAPGRVPGGSSEATEIDAEVNTTLRIPVIIDKVSAIEGIDISIAFDKKVLNLTGLTLNDGILANNDYAVETNLEDGKMVIYALTDLIAEQGPVAFIEFDVIGEVGTSSEISFTKFDVNELEASGGLQVVDSEGNEIVTRRVEATVVEPIPEKFAFYPNYPNPFRTSTTIKYDLPEAANVKIQIYNIRGQLVTELVNGIETAGTRKVVWNAEGLANGIYFCNITAGNHNTKIKLVLMR